LNINNLLEAQRFLSRFIPKEGGQLFTGDWGLKRTKYFLSLMGNPQNNLTVVHIAGTSGKGSTAYLTSHLLNSQRFKVGLSVSPHIIDIRERCQINNRLISIDEFCQRLSELIPFINKVKQTSYGSPTYFEILVVLAFYIFFENKVDYAVIETGLGGLYDATNTVTGNKLVILTKIGFDHTQILGKTLSKIAYQKAMIIKMNNLAISVWQKPSAQKIIEKISNNNQAKLLFVKKGIHFKKVKIDKDHVIFDFQTNGYRLKSIYLNILGLYQAENASLALTALFLLSKRDGFVIDEEKIRQSLLNVTIPARMEIRNFKRKKIIIDGAHNPQKMTAFLTNLKKIFPNKKFTFLIAFKQSKDFKTMLKLISPLAEFIIITSFFITNLDLIHLSVEPIKIANQLKKIGFYDWIIVNDPKQALSKILDQKSSHLVITGSFYLIGKLYLILNKI